MWQEGQDGDDVRYRERLHAHLAVWAFAVFLTATLGIAYARALGPFWGAVTFVATMLCAAWLLLATAPLVQVDERVLRAGRARLPREHIGRVRVLSREELHRLQGVDADTRAFRCVRSWVPRAVVVEVADPRDPHPYWLVSTRDPDAVAAALLSTGSRPTVAP